MEKTSFLDLPREIRQKILISTITYSEIDAYIKVDPTCVKYTRDGLTCIKFKLGGQLVGDHWHVNIHKYIPFDSAASFDNGVHAVVSDDMRWVKEQWSQWVSEIGKEKVRTDAGKVIDLLYYDWESELHYRELAIEEDV